MEERDVETVLHEVIAQQAGELLFVLDASVRNVFRGVAGPTVADAPGLSTLLALAVLGTAARPIARTFQPIEAIREMLQRLRRNAGGAVLPGHGDAFAVAS